MKTIKSKRTKINTKLLLAALATAFTLANPMTSITAHADLVDETNEWNQEGQAQPENITPQENQEHTTQNVQAQEAGTQTPAPQDANAVVDNSQGGQEVTQPNPAQGTGDEGNADPSKGEVTNWKDYDPSKDPTAGQIQPGEKDEVDWKTPTTPNTPPSTPPSTPPNTPSTPSTPSTPTNTTSTPAPTPVPKTDDGTPYGAAGVAAALLTGGIFAVIKSRKRFNRYNEIDSIMNRK